MIEFKTEYTYEMPIDALGMKVDTNRDLEILDLCVLPDNRIVNILAATRLSVGDPTMNHNTAEYGFEVEIVQEGCEGLYQFILFENQRELIKKVREKRLKDKKSNIKWDKDMKRVGAVLLDDPSERAQFLELGAEDYLYQFKF
ncbi:TPA: hypothetical protein RQK01_004037 [Vibrio vulnificus]|nr:hypothetical protein [Vibrio vulnificus]